MKFPARAALGSLLLASLSPFVAVVATDVPRRLSVDLAAPSSSVRHLFGKTRVVAEVPEAQLALVKEVEFRFEGLGPNGPVVERIHDSQPPFEQWFDFSRIPGRVTIAVYARPLDEFSELVETGQHRRRFTATLLEEVDVTNVILGLTLKSTNGASVSDLFDGGHLTASHVAVDEKVDGDWTAQEILEFRKEIRPIDVILLVDSSGSMLSPKETRKKTELWRQSVMSGEEPEPFLTTVERVRKAASGFLAELDFHDGPDSDRAYVIDFDERVTSAMVEFTNDPEILEEALSRTDALGGTAIRDAVIAAMMDLRRLADVNRRQAIVLLTDGDDRHSSSTRAEAEAGLIASNVTVFAIALGTRIDSSYLGKITEMTGGQVFKADRSSDLTEVYKKIAAELKTQYSVSYAPSDGEQEIRQIRVRIDHPDLQDKPLARRYRAQSSTSQAGNGGDDG